MESGPADAASGRLAAALVRLEEVATLAGCRIGEGLQPGLSEDEVRAKLEPYGIDPPDDLVTFFG